MSSTYKMLSGEVLDLAGLAPEVEAFLARVQVSANDPEVTLADLVMLIYAEENPLLKSGVIPGRGMVTREAFASPAYQAMLDLIGVKQVQLGMLEPTAKPQPMSVTDTAKVLGVSSSAVRQAIAAGRLKATKVGNAYQLDPSDVAAFTPARRGPPSSRSAVVEVRLGSAQGFSLAVVSDGEVERRTTEDHMLHGELAGWSWAALKASNKTSGDLWFFRIEPSDEQEEIRVGPLGMEGRFRIVERINNPIRAKQAWKEARSRFEELTEPAPPTPGAR